MRYIFILSGDNVKLAKEEIFSLINFNNFKLVNKLLVADIDNVKNLNVNELSIRLALTKSIYLLLFECNKKDFIKNLKNYNWNSIYKKNFCIRIPHQKIFLGEQFFAKFSEKNIAGYIWDRIKNPKVNLDNPKTLIAFFFANNKLYCGLLLKEIFHDFDKRKSHLRPRPSPTSLHPKLARAMVNLTGIKNKNETIADLFCGSGGIPLEAGLMGFKTIANDINKKMLWKTLVNLRHYKIKDYSLMNRDILKINDKFNYVVSDLPYGLNSSIYFNKKKLPKANFFPHSKELESFYLKILKRLKKIANKKIILIFPHFVDYLKLIKVSRLKLKNEFSIYVHKSLTRRIVILEK